MALIPSVVCHMLTELEKLGTRQHYGQMHIPGHSAEVVSEQVKLLQQQGYITAEKFQGDGQEVWWPVALTNAGRVYRERNCRNDG